MGYATVDEYNERMSRRAYHESLDDALEAAQFFVDAAGAMGRRLGRGSRPIQAQGPHGAPSSDTVGRLLRDMRAPVSRVVATRRARSGGGAGSRRRRRRRLRDKFGELVSSSSADEDELTARLSLGFEASTMAAERSNSRQRQVLVNNSGAELGTAAEVIAVRPTYFLPPLLPPHPIFRVCDFSCSQGRACWRTRS